jgi:DNA-binding transcriptional ArsR family regulator
MKAQPCSTVLKALADDTRCRIVRELLAKSLTVGELTERTGATQYNVSKHLRVLREAGVIQTTKVGKMVECSLVETFRKQVKQGSNTLDFGCCTFSFTESVPLKIRTK